MSSGDTASVPGVSVLQLLGVAGIVMALVVSTPTAARASGSVLVMLEASIDMSHAVYDTVVLTVSVHNDGTDDVDGVEVAMSDQPGQPAFETLSSPPQFGDDGDDILEQGETWTWDVERIAVFDLNATAVFSGTAASGGVLATASVPVSVRRPTLNLPMASPGGVQWSANLIPGSSSAAAPSRSEKGGVITYLIDVEAPLHLEYFPPPGFIGTDAFTYTVQWDQYEEVPIRVVAFVYGRPADEILFHYRADGHFAYHLFDQISGLPIENPINSGDGYTPGWSSISPVDLDGDGQDEVLFYRDDGLFRYYNVMPDGNIGSPILKGDGYTKDWSSIAAVDLDGDGQDEMFFYRDDGLFRYYNILPDGNIRSPILQGDGYTKGWTSIKSLDLEGDGRDEMFFYRTDGLYRFYRTRVNGSLGSPLSSGSNYPADWQIVQPMNLDGHLTRSN